MHDCKCSRFFHAHKFCLEHSLARMWTLIQDAQFRVILKFKLLTVVGALFGDQARQIKAKERGESLRDWLVAKEIYPQTIVHFGDENEGTTAVKILSMILNHRCSHDLYMFIAKLMTRYFSVDLETAEAGLWDLWYKAPLMHFSDKFPGGTDSALLGELVLKHRDVWQGAEGYYAINESNQKAKFVFDSHTICNIESRHRKNFINLKNEKKSLVKATCLNINLAPSNFEHKNKKRCRSSSI